MYDPGMRYTCTCTESKNDAIGEYRHAIHQRLDCRDLFKVLYARVRANDGVAVSRTIAVALVLLESRAVQPGCRGRLVYSVSHTTSD